MARSTRDKSKPSADMPGERRLPQTGEVLKPRNFFLFLWTFISGWFLSRPFSRLLAGIPFVVFVILLCLAAWTYVSRTKAGRIETYQRAVAVAIRDGNDDEADLYLAQLALWAPSEKHYQFSLMLHLVERGKLEQAAQHLQELTSLTDDGYAAARLWMVERDLKGDSTLFELTPEMRQKQLLRAVQEEPHNARAHRLLAQTYLERNELILAERHLLGAVAENRSLGLLLYQLQTALKRPQNESIPHLRAAARAFEELTINRPDEPEFRINWSQSLALLGETDDAEQILKQGLQASDSPELRSALAQFYLNEAQKRLRESLFNQVPAGRLVAMACRTDPSNLQVVTSAIAYVGQGIRLASDDLQAAISHLRDKRDSAECTVEERTALAQLLQIAGDLPEAIQTLESHADANRVVQSLLVRLYRADGQSEKADQLVSQLVENARQQLADDPDSASALMEVASALGSAQDFEGAIALLDERLASEGKPSHLLSPTVKQMYVAQCLGAWDLAQSSNAAVEPYVYLRKAIETRLITIGLLQRLVVLSTSDDPHAQEADDALVGLLAGGQANSQIYSLLGTHHLASGNHERAVAYLRQAYSMSPADPMVQNNYALALIRTTRDNFSLALDMCEKALSQLPGHPDLLSTRAEIFMARGRWEDARRDLETALPDRGQSASLRRLLVRVYTELNEERLASENQRILDELEPPPRAASTETADQDS